MKKLIIILAFMFVFVNAVFCLETNGLFFHSSTTKDIIAVKDTSELLEKLDTTFYFIMDNQIDIVNSRTGSLTRRHSKGSLIGDVKFTNSEICRIKNEFLKKS